MVRVKLDNLISHKAESILNYMEAGANQGESLSLLIPESNLSQINLFFRTGFSKEKFMYGISLDTKGAFHLTEQTGQTGHFEGLTLQLIQINTRRR